MTTTTFMDNKNACLALKKKKKRFVISLLSHTTEKVCLQKEKFENAILKMWSYL